MSLSNWDNLSSIVTKRTYARTKGNGKETWGDIVERAIAGNVRGFDVKEDEVKDLREFMMKRKAMPAGRGLWFSGSPSHETLGGAALNNCFAGDEKFITSEGVKTFREVVGSEVEVLCEDRVWRTAKVRSFGVQGLQKVTFKPTDIRSNQRFEHVCTPDHRWVTRRGVVTDLEVGDVVPTRTCTNTDEVEYKNGFVHGLIFADGTKHTYYENRKLIRLCGEKKKHAEAVRSHEGYRTESTESETGDPILTIVTDIDFKELPKTESLSYLSGFIDGWRKLDGSTRNRLSSQHPKAKEWLDTYAAMCGYIVIGFTIDDRPTNYGERSHPCYTFTLSSDQIEFRVESVEKVEAEEVFCVMEPVTKTFTLASGIVTGNCWFVTSDAWFNFVLAQDLLMLGGGVGMSVEHRFVSKLPGVKKGVTIEHKMTNDADFIVPDSREGWCRLFHRVLEAYFVTGEGFSYSTVCVRGKDEPINGFGGSASGPKPLIAFIEKVSAIMNRREGRHLRPIDAMDVLCCTGEMVVSGNVRRSAIIIIGDPWDREYLTSKRWDLKDVPTERAFANLSVCCSDVEDLHPSFWKTYEHGEPFGIVNRKNIQKYGRMGELLKDTAIGVNPCAEATLESGEPCNLQEIFLPRLNTIGEFAKAGRLMHRWGKRVCAENYHHDVVSEVINRNARIGTGITGCLQSKFFNPEDLDYVYRVIQEENKASSKEYNLPLSIRTTVVKPSGTLSLVGDVSPGIHPTYSPYYIRRVRFASTDTLIPLLREAGHPIEPVLRFDGTVDRNTSVVNFYKKSPEGTPTAKDFDTWKQLDVLLMAQKCWADQAVSVTVYYKREELNDLKDWLRNNLNNIKTISFLCHSNHGFDQAPLEEITQAEYEKMSAKIKPVDTSKLNGSTLIDGLECQGGSCPTR